MTFATPRCCVTGTHPPSKLWWSCTRTPYPGVQVKKCDCVNHAHKRMGTALRKLAKDEELGGKGVGRLTEDQFITSSFLSGLMNFRILDVRFGVCPSWRMSVLAYVTSATVWTCWMGTVPGTVQTCVPAALTGPRPTASSPATEALQQERIKQTQEFCDCLSPTTTPVQQRADRSCWQLIPDWSTGLRLLLSDHRCCYRLQDPAVIYRSTHQLQRRSPETGWR
ncbi:uncharacterized protein [Littorina saxatilis]|uniref:uncharacterized protein n=1 Tax=Littorina saxatilis TaxID=31220 RepID=UPI0038B43724